MIEQLQAQILALNEKLDLLLGNKSNCKYSFYDWLNEWLVTYKKNEIRPKSYKDINNCINNHIKSYIANCNLAELDSLTIQKCLNVIPTTRTRKYTFQVFNGCLNKAYQLGLINKNPMLMVNKVIHNNKVRSALTKEEQSRFIRCIRYHKYEQLFKFYLYSGCRLSEALAIKWADVNFKKKQIVIPGTKTVASFRVIPLFEKLEILLKNLDNSGEFVFPFKVSAIDSSFKRLKKKYNLNFTIHQLRHTFATRCLESGVHLKTVQKWLGHSSMEVTANIYSHVQSEFELKEVKKIKM